MWLGSGGDRDSLGVDGMGAEYMELLGPVAQPSSSDNVDNNMNLEPPGCHASKASELHLTLGTDTTWEVVRLSTLAD